MKILLRKLNWFLVTQIGIDVKKIIYSFLRLPKYIKDLGDFSSKCEKRILLKPCLHDRYHEAGSINNEYFWQDLFVARRIFIEAPLRHIDVGSRIDGFVSHVASFRDIEVFDIRKIETSIPGVRFFQSDLMDKDFKSEENKAICDSLSCLHALEHFGLGRYGDKIEPQGYITGISNLAHMLSQNGILYVSVPIGYEHVEFNANWVFNPRTIAILAKEYKLDLMEFYAYSPDDKFVQLEIDSLSSIMLNEIKYTLGIYIFSKT